MAEFKVFDFDPHNLPPDILAALGLVIACSVQTENIVEDVIAGLFDLEIVPAKILTTNMNMQVRASALRTAAERRWGDTNTYNVFEKAVTRVEKAVGERNRLAHLTWQRDPDTGDVYTSKVKARTGLRVHMDKITADSIRAIAEEVYHAGLDLMSTARLAKIGFPDE
jgi:hypothetical protein